MKELHTRVMKVIRLVTTAERMNCYGLATIAFLALVRSTAAAPTASLARVPISAAALVADPVLAGYQCWDLRVSIDPGLRWFHTGLDALVTSGAFYNPVPIGNNAPQPHLWNAFPQLRYDTFITQAADPNDDATFENPQVASAFPEFPVRPPIFTDTHISATYAFTSTHFAVGPGQFTVARLTLSEGATVTMFGLNAQSNGADEPFAFTLVVPEPASWAAMLAVFIPLVRRQRC